MSKKDTTNKFQKNLSKLKEVEDNKSGVKVDDVPVAKEVEGSVANSSDEPKAKEETKKTTRKKSPKADYSNAFMKKEEKVLINFSIKESIYKRLITLAESENVTLTEVAETSFEKMLDAFQIEIDEELVEQFKERNAAKGRSRKK